MRTELKLTGAEVIDGSGAKAFRADVAVTGDTITAIGDLSRLDAAATVDCSGKIVAPGFIDIHSHSDFLVPGDPDHGVLLEAFIRQGMTTIVGGNCGFSPAPVSDRTREVVSEGGRLIADHDL